MDLFVAIPLASTMAMVIGDTEIHLQMVMVNKSILIYLYMFIYIYICLHIIYLLNQRYNFEMHSCVSVSPILST